MHTQVVSRISDLQMLPDFAKSALDSGSPEQELYLKMDHKEGYFRFSLECRSASS